MPPFESSDAVKRLVAGSLRPTTQPRPGVVSLLLGEPDFDTPPAIVEAAVEALRGGYTHYPEFSGDSELREALAAVVSEIAGERYERDQVFVTHGGTGGISAAIMGTLNPGDRLVIPEPSYSLYPDVANMIGAIPVFVATTPDYHLDLERIEAALPGAKMLVICNPCNPTGAVYGREELMGLAELCERYDVTLLADEAYYSLVYDNREFVSTLTIPSLRPRLIYVQTFSKTYAMTGWRSGYIAGPLALVKAAGGVHRTFNGVGNAAVQRAALAAARIGPKLAEPMLREYTGRRAIMLDALSGIPGLRPRAPEGTFYLFARYDYKIPSAEMLTRLYEAGVAIRAGREYGPHGEYRVRFSFAVSPDDIAEGARRLRGLFERLAAESPATLISSS